MILFAVDLDTIFKIGIPLIMLGIWLINQLSGRGEGKPEEPARPARRRPVAQPQAEPGDIDEFLDEVLGRAPGGRPAPAPNRPDPDVVVLRPTPVSAPVRPRPDARRPRPARPPRPSVREAAEPPRPKINVMAEVKAEVDRAAASTSKAAMGASSALLWAAVERAGNAQLAELAKILRTRSGIQQAIVFREILGPPRAHRRFRSRENSII